MAKEYIDREKLKTEKVYSEERHEYIVPVAVIDWQPAADVAQVVRCKDCQYWKDGICGFFSNYGITGFIKAAEYITQPDSFCSWAMARAVPVPMEADNG